MAGGYPVASGTKLSDMLKAPGAPANLVDIEVDGRPIRAAAQVTKQGFVFVFDRRTGEPVWPI